jgi:drug/metabolite transporter (DMT)-like permease
MGERLDVGDFLGLMLITAGMVIVLAYQHRHRNEPAGDARLTSALLASGSCVAIGVALYALSQSSAELGTAWTLVVLKGVGIVLLATVLFVRGMPSVPREAFHLIVPAGIADNIGFASFLAGTAAGSIAIPAVLGSQFSIVAALIGIVLFEERLARVQALGLAVIIIGVAILAAQR